MATAMGEPPPCPARDRWRRSGQSNAWTRSVGDASTTSGSGREAADKRWRATSRKTVCRSLSRPSAWRRRSATSAAERRSSVSKGPVPLWVKHGRRRERTVNVAPKNTLNSLFRRHCTSKNLWLVGARILDHRAWHRARICCGPGCDVLLDRRSQTMRVCIAFALLLSVTPAELLRPMVDPARAADCALTRAVRRTLAVVVSRELRAGGAATGRWPASRDPGGVIGQARACVGTIDQALRSAASHIGALVRQVLSSGLGSQHAATQRATGRVATARGREEHHA